jgi:DNA gyrase subunit B
LFLLKKKGQRKGNYIYSDEELAHEVKDLPAKSYTVQRYKGLGEMDAEQLWETTMEPKNRILLRVEVEDAAQAERAVADLMGTQVEKRKEFIQKHALDARFLDI